MEIFALYIFLFSLGAFFVPVISRWVLIPGIVGEIFYGMLLYYFLPNPEIDLTIIEFLAMMGFIYLMFLAGLEVNFDLFTRESIKTSLIALVGLYIATFFYWFYFVDQTGGYFPLIIFSATSVGVTFIALKNNNQERSKYGQNILIAVSIGEMVSILGMILFEINHLHGGSTAALTANIFKIILLMGGAYLLIRLILLFFWWFPGSVEGLSTKGDTSELTVRLSILVLLTMVAISASFHLELILGAFIGGLMLAFVFRDKRALENKLSSIGYGFFIPFFFIKVGYDFRVDNETIGELALTAAGFYAIFLLLRSLSGFAYLGFVKDKPLSYKIKTVIATTFILSSPLTLLIAIAKLGFEIKVINYMTYNALILTAMLGGFVGPTVYSLISPDKQSLQRRNKT